MLYVGFEVLSGDYKEFCLLRHLGERGWVRQTNGQRDFAITSHANPSYCSGYCKTCNDYIITIIMRIKLFTSKVSYSYIMIHKNYKKGMKRV